MDVWQAALGLLSFCALTAVGASVARRNWSLLSRGSVVRSGGATLMADEWHFSHEARMAMRQAFWLLVGVFLAVEGLLFGVIGVYTLLFG